MPVERRLGFARDLAGRIAVMVRGEVAPGGPAEALDNEAARRRPPAWPADAGPFGVASPLLYSRAGMTREEGPARPAAGGRLGRMAAALDSAEAGSARPSRRLRRAPDRALLPLFLAAGAAASVALGIDRNWDLLNYHLYNPLALTTDRGGDIAPPGAQVFFNPAADLPFHWLLRSLNEHPAAVAALMGLPAGAAAFLVLLLARSALRGAGVAHPGALAGLAAFGAATGAGFRGQIGATLNDLPTAVPVLAALLLALRAALAPRAPPAGALLLLAGALAGAAVGLKLTNAPFAVALGGALAAALRAGGKPSARPLGLLLCGGALGFAAAAGPWMLRLWQEWGNPFFPYFDALFAAGRPPAPIGRDPRFFPQGALEWLFFPFTWALSDAPRSSEVEMRDPRAALALLALVALALGARRCLARPAVAFLAAFLALSYPLWLAAFSIYRYALVIEALSPLLALVAVAAFAPPRRALLFGALLVGASAAATEPPAWGRAPLGPRYLDAALPELPPGALLLLRRDEPLAYLAAVAPAGTRFAGLSAVAQFGPSSPFADRLRRALEEAPPTYVMAMELDGAAEAAAASGLRLEPRSCRRVCTNWTSGGIGPLVCPAAAAGAGDGTLPAAPVHRGPRANTLCGMAGTGLALGGRRGPRLLPEGALLWPPAGCRRLRLATEHGAAPRLLADAGTERAGEGEAVLVLAPGGGPLALRSGGGGFHLRAAECLD